ncbi:MAG TPA: hypothetical protein ENJ75_02310 [Candidatus Kaiserbacteria bacterium]|nr:hypothetical protein [Candidatus Kaiserbacteria bacterium]
MIYTKPIRHDKNIHSHEVGSIMLLALVFGAVFLTVFSGLSGYVLSENNFEVQKRAQSQAISLAEAGLEYYRWHLAHYPNDLQNGTGQAGPYTVTYKDPQGGDVGTYTLNIKGNQSCGQTTSIDISSTGVPADDQKVSETLVARYAQPTVAQYSYIVNASVWAGGDRIINGPYHSNGGIRMDGTTNAPVTSSLSKWTCTSSFHCTPNRTVNGVFGDGSNQNLWDYPTPQVDFGAISANFTSLKTIAEAQGLYFPALGSGKGYGYHLIFNGDGTVTIKKVTRVYVLWSIPIDGSSDGNFARDYTLIRNEVTVGTYDIPSNCGLIYIANNVWVEGKISRKVTLVTANTKPSSVATNAVLRGNIVYTTPDAGFTLLAQNDVLIAPDSPDYMNIDGVFVAQGGAFGRNLYTCSYPSYSIKNTLTILGSTISNKRTATKWGYFTWWCGYNVSGYMTRIDSIDRSQYSNPPPFTPTISTDYKFVDWSQK